MKKIAGYYRISIEDDNLTESNSITNQRMLVERYIKDDEKLCKYKLCDFYDDGYSGTIINRPGLKDMLEQINRGEIEIVIVKDISRLSRDYIELGMYMEHIFPAKGIRFIAIADHYDSDDYMGRTVDIDMAFKGILADYYCKDISAKVKSSLEVRRRQGRYSTGLTPFGYGKADYNPYRLIVIEEEATIIRDIYKLAIQGYNFTQICKKLNDEGVKTPLEYINLRKKQNRRELQSAVKIWQPSMVRTILTNESYTGAMVYNKTEKTLDGKNTVKPRVEWKVYRDHHEPIISRETFDMAKKSLSRRKSGARKVMEYPLKSKLYCGYCKRALKAMKLAKNRLALYCESEKISSKVECMKESIDNEELEAIVLREIISQLNMLTHKDESIKTLCAMIREREKEYERELILLERRLRELTKKKAESLEKYHAGILNTEQYMEYKDKIVENAKEVSIEYEDKKRQKAHCVDDIRAFQKNSESLHYLEMERLTREMVEAFIDRIEIGRDRNIDIYWRFNNKFYEIE